ncbi:unnamed protein product, partial [Nesidiocoris tenuis]
MRRVAAVCIPCCQRRIARPGNAARMAHGARSRLAGSDCSYAPVRRTPRAHGGSCRTCRTCRPVVDYFLPAVISDVHVSRKRAPGSGVGESAVLVRRAREKVQRHLAQHSQPSACGGGMGLSVGVVGAGSLCDALQRDRHHRHSAFCRLRHSAPPAIAQLAN